MCHRVSGSIPSWVHVGFLVQKVTVRKIIATLWFPHYSYHSASALYSHGKKTHLRSQWKGTILFLQESMQKWYKRKLLCPNLKQCPSIYLKRQKKHENPQSWQPISKPRCEHRTFWIQTKSTTHSLLVFSTNLSNIIILYTRLLTWIFAVQIYYLLNPQRIWMLVAY